MLSNDAPSLLEFCKKLPNSSDSNEYYEVITEDGRHLAVETVNRYAVPDELEGTKREVYASALPFELTVFRDEDAYNRFCGFAKPVKAGGADVEVHGLSTTFTCPSTIFRNGEDDAPWSFVAGEIKNFREITLDVDSVSYKAYLVVLRSALGDLPTLVGNEVFDTSEIAVGKIVGMNAYIKANFIKDKYPNIR
ncbi:MAG: hypothetical protein IJU94_06075 [Clostridia bacterium]|nr:hypothetical protein [Clostridia bacterium]